MRLPDGWLFTPRQDEKDRTIIVVEKTEIVRCRNCKHRFIDGDNVKVARCELNHNELMQDEWFCADGEAGTYEDA